MRFSFSFTPFKKKYHRGSHYIGLNVPRHGGQTSNMALTRDMTNILLEHGVDNVLVHYDSNNNAIALEPVEQQEYSYKLSVNYHKGSGEVANSTLGCHLNRDEEVVEPGRYVYSAENSSPNQFVFIKK